MTTTRLLSLAVCLAAVCLAAVCLAACGCQVATEPQAPVAQIDDLGATLAGLKALDAWAREAPNRECSVSYVWGARGVSCGVILRGLAPPGRMATGIGPDVRSAATKALAAWKKQPQDEPVLITKEDR